MILLIIIDYYLLSLFIRKLKRIFFKGDSMIHWPTTWNQEMLAHLKCVASGSRSFQALLKILRSVGYFDWLAKIGNCVWVQAEFETNLKLGTKATIRSVHQLLQPITRVSDVVIEEVLSDINSILAASQRSCDTTIATSPKQKSCANTRRKPH